MPPLFCLAFRLLGEIQRFSKMAPLVWFSDNGPEAPATIPALRTGRKMQRPSESAQGRLQPGASARKSDIGRASRKPMFSGELGSMPGSGPSEPVLRVASRRSAIMAKRRSSHWSLVRELSKQNGPSHARAVCSPGQQEASGRESLGVETMVPPRLTKCNTETANA